MRPAARAVRRPAEVGELDAPAAETSTSPAFGFASARRARPCQPSASAPSRSSPPSRKATAAPSSVNSAISTASHARQPLGNPARVVRVDHPRPVRRGDRPPSPAQSWSLAIDRRGSGRDRAHDDRLGAGNSSSTPAASRSPPPGRAPERLLRAAGAERVRRSRSRAGSRRGSRSRPASGQRPTAAA